MIHVEQHGPVIAIRMARAFLGRPLCWVTAYWIDGLLVDTGPSIAAPQLLSVLRRFPVKQVVLTHSHEAQIGGLATLRQQFPNVQIYASARAIPYLTEPVRIKMQLYRRMLWGVPAPISGVTTLDEANNVLHTDQYTFRVIETPGHTVDHIALFEPTHRWIFSGDTFTYGREETWVPEADLFGVISSLRTLDSLHPERLFASDGRVSRTPRPELHQKIGELIRLTREVAKYDAAGLNVTEMATRLFGKEPLIHFWSLGHCSVANLIEACRSYNALFAPLDDEQPPLPPVTSEDEEIDTSDSSTNLSADWGDLIR